MKIRISGILLILLMVIFLLAFFGEGAGAFCKFCAETDGSVDLSSVSASVLKQREVGVKAGDWARYGFVLNFSSDDPDPPLFAGPPPSWVEEVEYFTSEVLSVVDTRIYFELTMFFENGTEKSDEMDVDVASWPLGLAYFVAANLTAGDSLSLSPYSPVINDTVKRVYAGAEREVNYLGQTSNYTESHPDSYRSISKTDAYWDRASGILCEINAYIQYTRIPEGYKTYIFSRFFLEETNTWSGKVRHLIGTGFGRIRIGKGVFVFGKASLFKVGSGYFELSICCEGKECTRIWRIIFHREWERRERYICYSEEYGLLIVGVRWKERCHFWYTVGRDTLAFGRIQ
ncbi:MAG: hypothetical protein PVH12_08515 [Candidatus Bathyarchaeota archaeon]